MSLLYKLPDHVDLPKEMPNYERLNKAKNLFARMAIVFDYEFYNTDPAERNDTKLYQYLYFIFHMLACKKKYFPNNYEYYSLYAVYASREIYMRAIRLQKRGLVIKSILNYAKAVLYSMKVGFQNEEFRCIVGSEYDKFDADKYRDQLAINIQSDNRKELSETVETCLRLIPENAMRAIRETPYKHDELMVHRLYASSLLTILNRVTLQNRAMSKIRSMPDSRKVKLLKNESRSPALLWHLDESMEPYVSLLSKRIMDETFEYLSENVRSFEINDKDLESILKQLYETMEGEESILE